MIKNGIIQSCPICESIAEPVWEYKTPEFGKDILQCPDCTGYSVRDLDHGVSNDEIPGSANRAEHYAKMLTSSNVKSVLEIGPGNWSFLQRLQNKSAKPKDLKLYAVDVGNNFIDTQKNIKNLTSIIIDPPETPEDIYNVSSTILNKINKLTNSGTDLIDVGISTHSLEHAPDPIRFVQAIAKNTRSFIIEVPNGIESLDALRSDFSNINVKTYEGPWPARWRVQKRKYKVGGHYQWFTKSALVSLVHKSCPPGTYYIGPSKYESSKSLVVTNVEEWKHKESTEINISQ